METYTVDRTFLSIKRCSDEEYLRLDDAWTRFCERHRGKFTPGLRMGEMKSVIVKHARRLEALWFRCASNAVKLNHRYRPGDAVAIWQGMLGVWQITWKDE